MSNVEIATQDTSRPKYKYVFISFAFLVGSIIVSVLSFISTGYFFLSGRGTGDGGTIALVSYIIVIAGIGIIFISAIAFIISLAVVVFQLIRRGEMNERTIAIIVLGIAIIIGMISFLMRIF